MGGQGQGRLVSPCEHAWPTLLLYCCHADCRVCDLHPSGGGKWPCLGPFSLQMGGRCVLGLRTGSQGPLVGLAVGSKGICTANFRYPLYWFADAFLHCHQAAGPGRSSQMGKGRKGGAPASDQQGNRYLYIFTLSSRLASHPALLPPLHLPAHRSPSRASSSTASSTTF